MANKGDKRNMDEIKGRAKRAWGEATDDNQMKNQGTVDKISGKLKEGIENVRDRANDLMDRKGNKR